jgi:hypothetical protein
MDLRHAQRGYTRIGKLVILLLLLAAGYFGAAFVPAASTYYRIRSGAQGLANRGLASDANFNQEIHSFVRSVYDREGVNLSRSDVYADAGDPDLVEISFQLAIPYRFPLIEQMRLWSTRIEVRAERN